MARYAPIIEAFEYTGDDAALAAWLESVNVDAATVPTIPAGDYFLLGSSIEGMPAAQSMPKAMFEGQYAPI